MSLQPPIKPMLATSVPEIPPPDSVAGGLLYEPKWDGFRCLAFVDGQVQLQSRDTRDLARYFPEVVALLSGQVPAGTVLDGEIIIPSADGTHLEFEALLARIHPAASRVQRLAAETPAAYVAFDLLAVGGESLLAAPFAERRAQLTGLLSGATAPLFVTPATDDPERADAWFHQFEGAGLDGVIAKPLAAPYAPDKRTMFKVKHARTADTVVAGYRLHKSGDGVGSLLLGLYDVDAHLHFVGVASSFAAARRRELAEALAPLQIPIAEHPWRDWQGTPATRTPGAPSRWNAAKELDWVPLDPRLVAEVGYDHLQGDRFRHTTRLRHFRPDREPASCTYAQLERPLKFALADVLAAG